MIKVTTFLSVSLSINSIWKQLLDKKQDFGLDDAEFDSPVRSTDIHRLEVNDAH